MNKEQYSTLIAQMAAQIFSGLLINRAGESINDEKAALGMRLAVMDAKELARLAGVEEPKE